MKFPFTHDTRRRIILGTIYCNLLLYIIISPLKVFQVFWKSTDYQLLFVLISLFLLTISTIWSLHKDLLWPYYITLANGFADIVAVIILSAPIGGILLEYALVIDDRIRLGGVILILANLIAGVLSIPNIRENRKTANT